MQVLAASAGATHLRNDDRWFFDAERGIFIIADASGPTYGGYHAPFAIDPALATVIENLDAEDLGAALSRANRTMLDLARPHDAFISAARAREHRSALEIALHAADAVRPVRWEHLRGASFAHFNGSMAICALVDRRLSCVQVGSNRIYLHREGNTRLLLLDHTLGSREPKTEPHFRSVLTQALGTDAVFEHASTTIEVTKGDRILMCTDGLWISGSDRWVDEVLREHEQASLETLIKRVAAERTTDATAVLISIS